MSRFLRFFNVIIVSIACAFGVFTNAAVASACNSGNPIQIYLDPNDVANAIVSSYDEKCVASSLVPVAEYDGGTLLPDIKSTCDWLESPNCTFLGYFLYGYDNWSPMVFDQNLYPVDDPSLWNVLCGAYGGQRLTLKAKWDCPCTLATFNYAGGNITGTQESVYTQLYDGSGLYSKRGVYEDDRCLIEYDDVNASSPHLKVPSRANRIFTGYSAPTKYLSGGSVDGGIVAIYSVASTGVFDADGVVIYNSGDSETKPYDPVMLQTPITAEWRMPYTLDIVDSENYLSSCNYELTGLAVPDGGELPFGLFAISGGEDAKCNICGDDMAPTGWSLFVEDSDGNNDDDPVATDLPTSGFNIETVLSQYYYDSNHTIDSVYKVFIKPVGCRTACYKVTFDNDGRSDVNSGTRYYRKTIGVGVEGKWYEDSKCIDEVRKPAVEWPDAKGYSFGGYYATDNRLVFKDRVEGVYLVEADDNSNWSVTEDTVLRAKWLANTYTVTLNANDGTAGSILTIYEKYGTGWATTNTAQTTFATLTLSGNQLPTRTGYTFAGYYDGQTGGNQMINTAGLVTALATTVTDNQTTWYAHWTPNIYTVILNANDGTAGSVTTIYEKYDTGWSTSSSGSSFNTNFTLSDTQLPTRTGYTFAGYADAASNGSPVGTLSNGTWTAPTGANTVSSDTTLYAQWTANTYNINYNFKGGEQWSSAVPSGYTQLEYIESDDARPFIDTGIMGLNKRVVIDAQYTGTNAPASRIAAGYGGGYWGTFIGVYSNQWMLSSSALISGTADSRTTLSAVFDRNANNKTHATLTARGETVEHVREDTRANATIKLFGGHTAVNETYGFVGRIYHARIYDNDTGMLLFDGIPAQNSSDELGMYDAVSRTFFANAGASGTFNAGNSITTITALYPRTYTYGVGAMVYGVPTRVGSSFEGWCSDVALTNCASPYEITTTDTGDKLLYAKWSCRAGYRMDSNGSCVGNTISVTYNNGGHGTTPQATSCTYGGTLMLPTALTTTGYTFDKWSVAGNTFNPHVSINCDYDSLGVYETPNGTSVTITATWTPTCNAITLNPNTGSAGTVAILYKKSGAPAVWYTDSACTNTFNYQTTSIVPSKSGDYTFRGFYLNQADADTISESQTDGVARHIKEDGQPTVTGNAWNVTGAETLYAGWAMDCNDPIANGSCTLNIGQNTTYTTPCDTGYVCVSGDGTYNPVCVNGTNNIVYRYNGGTVGSTDLPAGYTQLEYVTSNGSAWIDTGIKLANTDVIETVFKNTTTSGGALYGVYASGQNSAFYANGTYYGYNSSNSKVNTNISVDTNWHRLVHDFVSGTLKLDNTTVSFTPFTFENTVNNYLFARYSSSSYGYGFNGSIKGYKITRNSQVILNLIPARYGNDVGLYDLVSGNFFTSITGTDFDAGPAVTTAYPTTYNVGVGVDVYGVPKRTGSVFAGWCRDSALSTGCAMAPHEVTTTDTGLVELHAKWTCKPGYTASGNSCVGNTYTVTLDKNHSDASGYIDPTPTIYEKYGTGWSKLQNSQFRPQFTLSEDSLPTRTGYSFDGYYDTAAATGGNEFGTFTINAGGNGIFDEVTWTAPSAITVTENTTVYARWTPITYNITYEWNGGTSNSTSLPNGYTQLEYIASDGTPFINTGIMGLNKRVVVDAQYTGTATSLRLLMGYDQNYTGTFMGVYARNWAINSSNQTSVSARDRTTVSVIFDRNADNYTHVMVSANGESVEYNRSNARPDAPIVLFNGGYTAVNTTYGFVGRIYHAAIYDKDTGKLLFNGVPAQNSSNELGLYDLVSRTFFTNVAGSGAFTGNNSVVATPYPSSYTYGVGATVYGVPTRTNSVFEAWCADSSLSINCVLPHEITTTDYGDKTLYAKWSCVSGYHLDSSTGSCVENTISVTYNNGGHGTAPSSPATCTYGGTLTLPAAITTTGYTFDQWSVAGHTFNAGSTITCNYNNLGVYETPNETSVTITATWTPTCNAIRLGPNGGIAGTVAMLYKKSGEPATWYDDDRCTTLARFGVNIIPRRSDWTFRGFYSDQVVDVTSSSLGSNFSQRIIDDQGQPTVAGNAWDVTVAETLYAGWAHDCDPTNAKCNLSVSGENVVYTTSCNTGYVYTSGQSAYNPVCEGRVYTITLNKNHNDATNWTHSRSVVYEKYATMWFVTPDAVSIDDPNPNSPVEVTAFTGTRLPTRAGYTFMGYYDAPTGENPVGTYSNGTWTLPPNNTYLSNATLYAHWTANAYNITYNWNNGTANSSVVPNGYTQVEYIVSDGNQKIDTGIYGMGKRVIVDAKYTGASSNTVKYLVGYYASNYTGTFAGVYSNKWGLGTSYKTNASATDLTRVSVYFDANSGSGYKNRATLTVNNETVTATRSNVLNNGTIWLLNAGTNGEYGFLGRVYHVLIYDDVTGAVMFDGIPVRSNSNDELGLYDTVSGTFFTATGSTALSAGSDVTTGLYPATYTAGVGTMIYGVPMRSGSVFAGWCRNSNLTTGCASPHEITATDYGDKPLYAKWDCAMGYAKNTQTGLCEASPAFTVTVKVPTNTTFKFSMAAKGNFTIDWGDASSVQIVNSTSVTKTEYSHTYTFNGSGTQTFDIKINGVAVGYANPVASAAISFFNATMDENDVIVENGDGTEVYIDHVSGSLGKIFRVIGASSPSNSTTPRFYETFRNAKNMTQTMASLSNLFSGVNGKTGDGMFYGTFRGCDNLTGAIPADLFGRVENGEYSGIDGELKTMMFAGTFYDCSGLTGAIPENLFGRVVNGVYHGIDGGTSDYAFSTTFNGCSGLTGAIPGNLFGRVVNGVYHGIDGAPQRQIFYKTFSGCSSLTGSIPETLFGRYVDGVYYGLKGTPIEVSDFSGTFEDCSGLTGSIPAGLFAGISGNMSSNTNMFYGTFSGCSGLTGAIPADLFGRVVNGEYVGIEGAPAYGMFRNTFSGCSGLTGAIPENLFGRVVNGVYHGINGESKTYSFYGTFSGCSGLTGAIPGNLFNRVVQVNGVDTFYGISGEPKSSVYRDLFNGCSGLTGSIPATLFGRTVNGTYYGVIGEPKDNMFNKTFYGCSGLTGEIPSYLFGYLDGTAKTGMFSQTFRGCSGLTGTIPGNLFGGQDLEGPAQSYSFYATFYGCTHLSGYVPVNLFGQVTKPAEEPTYMMSSVFYNTGLATSCPCGTTRVTSSPFTDKWNGKVSCTPGLSAGQHWYNGQCTTMCSNAAIDELHVGALNAFPVLTDKLTTPSINIKLGNKQCYVPLATGNGGTDSLNMSYGGNVYHADRPDDVQPAGFAQRD